MYSTAILTVAIYVCCRLLQIPNEIRSLRRLRSPPNYEGNLKLDKQSPTHFDSPPRMITLGFEPIASKISF